MKVLCACEYTQEFTMALRQRGVESYSCDILPAEKESSIHFMDDLENVLKIKKFDAVIGFPPCTYLTSAGGHLWRNPERKENIYKALLFFRLVYESAPIVAIENPLGMVSNARIQRELFGREVFVQRYSQVVSWYQFGDDRKKRTCLWLKKLPLLLPTTPGNIGKTWITNVCNYKGVRSRMSPNFAQAAADQWAVYLKNKPTNQKELAK